MAAVETSQIPLGFNAPDFSLPDTVSGKQMTLQELKGAKATVIMFICNHCPYVKHVNKELVRLAHDYANKGVSFIAINSNDISRYPDDAPDKMKETAKLEAYPFPYLFDADQTIAKAYYAECTPDFSIFDGKLQCIYRGRLDASRPGSNIPVSGEDIRKVLDAVIEGGIISDIQYPSIGCSIKWKT